jgi:hypothetical protein
MQRKIGLTLLIIGGLLILFSLVIFFFGSSINGAIGCKGLDLTEILHPPARCNVMSIVTMLGGMSLIPGIIVTAIGSYTFRTAK